MVLSYLKKHKKASTMAIARLLVKDHPVDFPKLTGARQMVRAYRGENNKPITVVDISKFKRTKTERKQFMSKIFTLPASDYEPTQHFKIPTGQNNILLLSDIHIPYQDNNALQLAIEYGIKQKVNAVYLNGDTLDMYQISRFIKDRRLRDIAGELELCRNFLKMLKETFECPIYYKLGNHEDRWENFLRLQAPELLGISDFELGTLLRFGEYGVNEVKSKQIAFAGKLAILHGHEFGASVYSPVNAARGLYLRSKESSIIGHFHQSSEHTEKSLTGDIVTTWSVGALCGLSPDYRPFNKWNHGFSIIKTYKDGNYDVQNLRIINGKVY